MSAPNVLHVNSAQEQRDFLHASHEVVAGILSAHGLTLIELAERVDCTVQTIGNAFNRRHVLSQAIQTRLAKLFGVHVLDPMAKLSGGRLVPLEAEDIDALPSTTAAIHKLAVAKSASSPGGERITHTELLDLEPEIDAAIRALTALKVRCGEVRAA